MGLRVEVIDTGKSKMGVFVSALTAYQTLFRHPPFFDFLNYVVSL